MAGQRDKYLYSYLFVNVHRNSGKILKKSRAAGYLREKGKELRLRREILQCKYPYTFCYLTHLNVLTVQK